MPIEFSRSDAKNINFDNVDSSGFPVAGRCLVRLIDVDEVIPDNGYGYEQLTFEIVAHEVPGQKGKRFKERVLHEGSDEEKTEKIRKRAVGIAKRMGLYTEQDLADCNPVDFSEGVDSEYVVDLEEQKPKAGEEGKTYVHMGYMGIYSVDDERVQEFLSDLKKKKTTGTGNPPPSSGNGSGSGSGAKSKPKTPAGSGSGASKRKLEV